VPRVRAAEAIGSYRAIHRAMARGLVRSCHAPALGGLCVALMRKAFAGELGLEVELAAVPGKAADDVSRLFSESNGRLLVTVAPSSRREFEASMHGHVLARIGTVREQRCIRILGGAGEPIVDRPLESLKSAWKERLSGL